MRSTAVDIEIRAAEALLSERRLGEARHRFDCAKAAGADADRCAAGRWMLAMLQGEFASAWRESDAIRARGKYDPHRFWMGESLHDKRVLLRCLHGFGDAVQFLRYAPRLRAIARSLVVEVNPRMVELARSFEGIDEVITWGDAAPADPPAWDVQIEIMELPYLFRTVVHELPLCEHYLHLRQPSSAPRQDTKAVQVGIVWTAGAWNAERSIPFSTLGALFEVSGCEFWDLQGEDERCARSSLLLREDAYARESLVGLAELIAGMDLVITVDTLAAHLAGALGVPCWVMLQHAADWRWMHGRKDSPWYPSLRLFRQEIAGDWDSVVRCVQAALRRQVMSR